jgi:3-deoxy-D-manno-octulosonic-acid transferase
MKIIWFGIYNYLIMPVFYVVIRLGGVFNEKVRRGLKGRKRIFEELILNSASISKNKKLIWFHSSSLGEFEQAKPIIEVLKKNKNINILVTFFSPSGYENSKKYPFADLVSYIPLDTFQNAKRFMQIVRPYLAVMMRYDIWPNHIWQLKKNNVPVFLVDATMKRSSPRKLPLLKNFHRILFKELTRILTVSKGDAEGFKSFGCSDKQINIVGDTRFDRVHHRSLDARKRNLINEKLLAGKKIFAAGSTWNADEEVIIPAFIKLAKYDKSAVLLIAPHEPSIVNLEKIENEFVGKLSTTRFSYMNNYNNEQVIIVDSIGILLTLYTYASAAFIGGSFKQNIHNVLEAAVYGIPVLFGPRIENSQETLELLRRGGGILIRNRREAYKQIRTLFSNEEFRREKGNIALKYVQENLGATEKIVKDILKYL